jgi:hypothetical protein
MLEFYFFYRRGIFSLARKDLCLIAVHGVCCSIVVRGRGIPGAVPSIPLNEGHKYARVYLSAMQCGGKLLSDSGRYWYENVDSMTRCEVARVWRVLAHADFNTG